jgi:hypothetical protein
MHHSAAILLTLPGTVGKDTDEALGSPSFCLLNEQDCDHSLACHSAPYFGVCGYQSVTGESLSAVARLKREKSLITFFDVVIFGLNTSKVGQTFEHG